MRKNSCVHRDVQKESLPCTCLARQMLKSLWSLVQVLSPSPECSPGGPLNFTHQTALLTTQTSHPRPHNPDLTPQIDTTDHTLGPSPQVWLLLNNLLVDPKARAKYDMDEYRKEAVLRVRRYLNDILLDQLPILRDLQRVLDELTMGVSSQPDESQTTRLIIEQVLL